MNRALGVKYVQDRRQPPTEDSVESSVSEKTPRHGATHCPDVETVASTEKGGMYADCARLSTKGVSDSVLELFRNRSVGAV